MKVTKAVIPAAGLGTRFLPATKAQPKEMLPLVDTPTIQVVVEEALSAGLADILIITGRGKRAIEDHFDRSQELEWSLIKGGKQDQADALSRIAEGARFHYVRQRNPDGLGAAVALAEDHVGEEPFAVLLGDDIIVEDPLLERMMAVHEQLGGSVIAVQEVPPSEISLYGVIHPEVVEGDLYRVRSIVEKPSAEEAPSNLAAIGRYILTPDIFEALRRTPKGYGGEIQLTDALGLLVSQGPVHALAVRGRRFDIGNKLDYLKATVEFALRREDVGDDFREFLASLNI